MILLIDHKPAVMKQGTSFEYHTANRLFEAREDYTLAIELPLLCKENFAIFGHLGRVDANIDKVFFDAEIFAGSFHKSGAVVVTEITDKSVKVQFLAGRSFQNFYPKFDNTFIDELKLGNIPTLRPALSAPTPSTEDRPGWASGTTSPSESFEVSVEEAWANYDVIALPWVNATSGNMQNRADFVGEKWKWHTVKKDDQDTEVVNGLSPQLRLYRLTELIAETLGYTFSAPDWEKSPFFNLYSFNTLPAAWGANDWARTLPHWSVNEFFNQLEQLMLAEVVIDHKAKTISISDLDKNMAGAGDVVLEQVVNEHSVTVSKDDESRYLPMQNVGYADNGSTTAKIENCPWFLRDVPQSRVQKDMTLSVTVKQLNEIDDYDNEHRDGPIAPTQTIYYSKAHDEYHILYPIGRIDGGKNKYAEHNYGNIYRLMPLNLMGDVRNSDDKEESGTTINIVPVRLEDTFVNDNGFISYHGELPFFEAGTTEGTGKSKTHGRRPGAETVEPYVVLPTALVEAINRGERTREGGYSTLQVGFWYGKRRVPDRLPTPFVSPTKTYVRWRFDNGKVKNIWQVEMAPVGCSLRLNADPGAFFKKKHWRATKIRRMPKVDTRKKYSFSFLSHEMPDVRSIFFIHGKKYLCAQIQAEITEAGMSELKKGTFYRVVK